MTPRPEMKWILTLNSKIKTAKSVGSNALQCNIGSPDFLIVWSLQRGDVDAAASLQKEKGKAKAKLT